MGKGGGGGGGAGKIDIPTGLAGPNSYATNVFQPLGTYASSYLSSLGSLYNWASNIATGGNVQGAGGGGVPTTGWLSVNPNQTYAPFTGTSGGGTGTALNPFNGGGTAGGTSDSLLGPLLGGAFSALSGAGQTTENLYNATGGGTDIFNQANQIFNQGTGILNRGSQIQQEGNNLVKMATTGPGLFPSQRAMVNQAVGSQQAATAQQLGNMGLGSSTVASNLAGQIKLSGAAAAGQLVQGNLQLGEEEQSIGTQTQQVGLQGEQLGVQAQQIGTAINEALYNEYAGIAQLSGNLQNQTYNQALEGMGALGQMYNATLNAFGYATKTQEDVLQANISEAQLQTEANNAANQASAGGFSSLMGGLGSLFGQSGTGGILGIGGQGGLFGSSGLLSSIGSGLGIGGGAGAGSLFAGGSALDAVAGGASAGGLLTGAGAGAAAGGGSALSGLISFIGGIFSCQIAQSVYGIDDPRWIDFRGYLLFRAPRPLRRAYVRNASWVSALVRRYGWLRASLKQLMGLAIWYDKATRT